MIRDLNRRPISVLSLSGVAGVLLAGRTADVWNLSLLLLAVLEGLRAGDSDLSRDILRGAAIDLTTAAPYDAGVRRMRALEDALRER